MTSVASTISTLQSFPGPGSIPPSCFYNAQGLANWLNNNPIYKLNFANTKTFPNLYPASYSTLFSTINLPGYNPENVPLCSNVTTLSQYQAQKYRTQLVLFHKVYSTNSNAYINFISTGQSPMYYTFATFQEKYDYNSAVALVNKLYPFKDMSEAVGWQVPFPIGL
jgi:hypothetical protein